MGQGIISISDALFDPFVFEDKTEQTKRPETLKEWHDLLMLPEDWQVVSVQSDPLFPVWEVLVESDAIMPRLNAIVQQNLNPKTGEKTTHLLRIEMNAQTIWEKKEP